LDTLVVATCEARAAVPASHTRLQHDSRVRRKPARARIDHRAGDVAAGDVRQRQGDAIEAPALPEIEMIQRTRAEANARASGSGCRIGCVFVAEDLQPPVLMEADRLHGAMSAISPSSRTRSDGLSLSRSPTITASRRSGSMCLAATAVTASSVSAII